jgi:hypothetical protein
VQAVQAIAAYRVPPWSDGATPVAALSALDGAFDEAEEAATVSIPAGPARQLLYLQAIDAAGSAGPVAAVFVDAEPLLFGDGFEPGTR